MILSCKNIEKAYGIDVILRNITFTLEEKEKAAIVGVNGAGKTTLFRILCGEISADGGDFSKRKDATLGYLAQNINLSGNRTIYAELESVFADLIAAETRLREIENEMGSLSAEELTVRMAEYDALQTKFEERGGYGYQSRIKGVLNGLGFTEEEYTKELSVLSGGQKTRVYLAKLLLTAPDILLLDEPTNHLDIAAIEWLEDFLRGYSGTVLIISHDRYFLDRTVSKIIEIEHGKSTVFQGNYTTYTERKEIHRQIAQKAYEANQKEIARQEEVIRTLRSFNREKSIKRAESRQKALDKMERVERPDAAPEKMRLHLSPQVMSGYDVLHGEGLSKSYGERHLFSNLEFDIKRGEKVALIGPNGVGKSTLFKILLKEVEPDRGNFRFGINVHVGYYDQEQQKLDESKTIFQEIADTYPNLTSGQIRNVLAAFVFTGDDVFKSISSLSGGERGRVALAKIMLSNSNLLMLDEPTNHLDMFSKEVLEDAINCYDGTVFYISHDRYFINRTAEKILELTPDGAQVYLGNYDYYLEKKAEQAALAAQAAAPLPFEKPSQKPKTQPKVAAPISDTKADWLKQKEIQAAERKKAAKIAKIEKEIEEVEQAIAQKDEEMAASSADYAKAQTLFEEKQVLEEKLEGLMEAWELAQEE